MKNYKSVKTHTEDQRVNQSHSLNTWKANFEETDTVRYTKQI